MNESKREKYTLFSNVWYVYKTLYEVKPAMRLGMVDAVTLAAAVASITEKGCTGHYLMVMAVMLAVYLICQFRSRYIKAWSDFYYETAQNREFLRRLVQKSAGGESDDM